MNDVNGQLIECKDRVKYSFNTYGIPAFTGTIIKRDGVLLIEHSNKVTIPLDETIAYIQIVMKGIQ